MVKTNFSMVYEKCIIQIIGVYWTFIQWYLCDFNINSFNLSFKMYEKYTGLKLLTMSDTFNINEYNYGRNKKMIKNFIIGCCYTCMMIYFYCIRLLGINISMVSSANHLL